MTEKMLSLKKYSCGICKTKPDQISHHRSHLTTQKHKDKRELFEFKLGKMSGEELDATYRTRNIPDIITETETTLCSEKLKSETIDNVDGDNDQEQLNILKAQMIEQSTSVSNKEALKDKIHEIHNYLRNNGAGYGMGALKVFNLIYGLKKIKENNLLEKVKLGPECDFDYLLGLANKYEDEKLAEAIFIHVLDSVFQSDLRQLLYYEIPRNIKGSVLTYLVKEINKITTIEKSCNVLLSGKIYEYFIGRDESAISELGAYFTDRHIVDFILKKLNPSVNPDGTIGEMIDMFGGSGGFTTGYIDFLNKKYPGTIDWANEINKIFHFDMNEDVIKSAGLEFFCLTGVLPNMKNLRYKNSFTDEFDDKKFKYPLTNPPYGGDKSVKSEAQTKREKMKAYIKNELVTTQDEGLRIRRQKQLKNIENQEKQEKKDDEKTKVSIGNCSARIQKFAKVNELKGTDKESCSLMLLMDILEVGGTAIGVLKEGVFFNKAYKDLRKYLIEKYNVREIISVPQDQFENTTTKTSIVIFDNTEQKTSEVKFSDLVVERYTEDKFIEIDGDIVIAENKGDILGVYDNLISQASAAEILSNPIFSLNGKDYGKKVISVSNEYELVRLSDICEFLPKSKRNASFGKPTGQYNFYTSSDKVQKCDIADYNDECLIIGDGGIANIKMDSNFSCSDHNHIIKTTNNHYIYHFLSGKIELLSNEFKGSVLKNLSKENFKKIQIPIPKSPKKIKEWTDKINKPYDEKNAKQSKIKELEIFTQNKIKDIEKTEECDELNFDDVFKYETKRNKYRASDGQTTGKYRFYTSSQDKILYRNDYEFENKHILIGRGGNASLHIASTFSVSHDDVYVLSVKNPDHNISYLYNYIKNNIQLIEDSFKGSTIKHSSKTALSQLKIKIPKNKQLIQDLESIFKQIETLQNEVKIADELYKQLIQELSNEAIPLQTTSIISETSSISQTIDASSSNTEISPIVSLGEEPKIMEEIKVKAKTVKKRVIKKPKQ